MTTLGLIASVLLILIALPIVAYYCCKLGTYGALRAYHHFSRTHLEKEEDHAK